ncbi:NADP-dependent oxidoreductase [Catenuloplanes atrovinosus]|uniref:NADPH:quinone reductase-like Zn-dependent oxidoreductase n=1 Tax=Catenuloplanes atrovinosus TaxID=137266 RepID=A0AAE4C902_9ACTN|nr:NADP-dependent oxidoreductase [Catenuloplanes atrovinosus]MDR7275533.1 NADPH:quinone reductase-like Zn-dependent oxidoreductase [Catenuloplanes atrovinosus]
MTETPTMRAISQDTLGTPDVLHEVRVPRPVAGLGEILVRVHAAGVNPTDWKHRAGLPWMREPKPILGWDVSGVVEQAGVGVTLFKPGDEVFGMLPYPRGAGGYAEYAKATARSFTHKPANLDHVHAAALPLAALTAHQALIDTADLQPGQRVLIHAAAGGVGHLAVQIAKARGAYVIGTASEPKHELVRGLGADEVIDYRRADFVDAVDAGSLDVVLDTVGGETRGRSLGLLRRGGTLVTLVFSPDDTADATKAADLGVRLEGLLVESDHAGMRAIAGLAAEGRLRPEIDATFPLAEAAKAHAHGETGRTTGKLVLTLG